MHNIENILKQLFKIMDRIKPQKPEFYEHLLQVMKYQGQYYAEDTVIYQIGEQVTRAMFISEGFITRSSQIRKKKVLLNIYEKNEIKAGPDFMFNNKSEFLIEATAGTYIAFITYEQLKEVYQRFPEAQELATLIVSIHNLKDARIRGMLQNKGRDLVYQFYKSYPDMTEPGAVLLDGMIASFLRISERTLREHRAAHFASGRLINPATLRVKKRIA
ncbi:hypothetical protein [Pedobacter sp. GR22-6]|uniref:hypothetical protein n=1 Tax=Pedobacter sp. GR22-6 TaxID=3127957 RepID=UPI00307F5B68